MPNTTHNISLDLRNSAQSGPGWHNVPASNGQTYSYNYSGGTDGAGGMTVNIGQGAATAAIRLTAANNYQISNCTFAGEGTDQMNWNGSSSQAGSIVDQNTGAANVKYSIIVTDTGNGNCTIGCDPQIINR